MRWERTPSSSIRVDTRRRELPARRHASCTRCSAILDGASNVVRLVGDNRSFPLPSGFSERLRQRLAGHIAPSAARLGNGGLEALAHAHRRDVHGVREGGGDGGGFFRRDARAAYGLLEGFAATDLDRYRFRRGQAGGHAGGRKGLVREDGDLGLGERRSLFRFRGLVYATGKQRHRDRGHRRKGVGRDAHRLATWIELSHRSPKFDDASRRQSY